MPFLLSGKLWENIGKNHKTSLGMGIKGNVISGIQGVNLTGMSE